MQFSALPPFFIVKLEKESQNDNRQKDGYFYTHSDHVFMQREKQFGEIVSIGEEAQALFPESKIGQTLIFHHFVTGREMEDGGDNKNLLYSDGIFNYYSVTVRSHKGEKNLCYGVFDGTKIIPHKQYVFLSSKKDIMETELTDTNLFVINNFTESRDELGNKMKEIKNEVKELVKSTANDDVKMAIEKKEKEMNNISKRVNKKQVLLYDVAFVSEKVKGFFSQPFTRLGFLNIACNTKLLFNGIEYIIADTTYLFCCAK